MAYDELKRWAKPTAKISGQVHENNEATTTHLTQTRSFQEVSHDDLVQLAGDDWEEVKDDPKAVEALAHMVRTTRFMKAGIRPPDYTKACHCKNCGWVWLWEGCLPEVLACPWCHIREPGVHIPRPSLPNTL